MNGEKNRRLLKVVDKNAKEQKEDILLFQNC
jgi:hypothetical protein